MFLLFSDDCSFALIKTVVAVLYPSDMMMVRGGKAEYNVNEYFAGKALLAAFYDQ